MRRDPDTGAPLKIARRRDADEPTPTDTATSGRIPAAG